MKMVHGFENEFSFLSNFAACDVKYHGNIYKTAEHAFQAAKATTKQDHDYVASAPTPGQAKWRGRSITICKQWDAMKDEVMLEIVRAKFQDVEMRQKLIKALADGWDGFCEDNYWHDNYWGNCTCPACAHIEGQNHLGKILMQVANEIVAEIAAENQAMREAEGKL